MVSSLLPLKYHRRVGVARVELEVLIAARAAGALRARHIGDGCLLRLPRYQEWMYRRRGLIVGVVRVFELERWDRKAVLVPAHHSWQ